MNTIYWAASTEPDVKLYEVESAPSATGPWTALGSVDHNVEGPAYLFGVVPQFVFVDGAGTSSTWYRIRIQNLALQYSEFCTPFQIAAQASGLLTSELEVCQMALAQLGETTTLKSLDTPTTKAEKLSALFLRRVRDEVLAAHQWDFATRRASLSQATDHSRAGWSYCYRLPVDAVRVVDIDLGYRGGPQASLAAGTVFFDPTFPTPPQARPSWSIEANDFGTGRILCCDVGPTISLVYVGQIGDPSVWDMKFTDAVTWALAARLSMPLAVRPELAQLCVTMAKASLAEAIAVNENQARRDPAPDSQLITGRAW